MNPEAILPRVCGNFIQEPGDKFFLLDKLDILQRLCRQLNRLIEPSLTSVANIKKRRNDDSCKSLIKKISVGGEVLLKLCRSCHNEAFDVGSLAIRNEHLRCCLSDFPHIVVSLLQSKAGKTQGRLSSSSMLLGQVHCELVQDLTVIPLHPSKQRAVAIHDQESELVVILHELRQRLRVKLAVTQIHRGVDWLERLKIDGQLLFFVVLCQNLATEDDEAIRRGAVILLQTLLCGCDCGQD
mmetsp:Transcript_41110/g.98052  ORF Transcript_41110/g.98052 Transcript_41110/m.98052 type:complete len:240 (+) Transcript_41110:743-1462(+)